jgi:hypothetical protein
MCSLPDVALAVPRATALLWAYIGINFSAELQCDQAFDGAMYSAIEPRCGAESRFLYSAIAAVNCSMACW